MNEWMKKAKEIAEEGMRKGGGPFGAIIVDRDGNVISKGNNQVVKQKDPTAHAEIVAIREACQKLETYDLSEYLLVTSCEPCPMCLSAIIWANIKTVYYGCHKEDAGKIGFRDDKIYDFIRGEDNHLLKLKEVDRQECLELFEKYCDGGGIIY